jgi:hypothetical protein
LRHVTGDLAGKWERPAPGAFEKRLGRSGRHRRQWAAATARDRDVIVKVKRDAEAVEAGAKIGCARRNADGDLVHDWAIQRLSATPL